MWKTAALERLMLDENFASSFSNVYEHDLANIIWEMLFVF